MCEFKIIKKNDGSQIGEDITILSYTDQNELLFKDILGMGVSLDSALIYEINTLNQTATVLEHPLIKDFMKLIQNVLEKQISKAEIESFQTKLEKLKSEI